MCLKKTSHENAVFLNKIFKKVSPAFVFHPPLIQISGFAIVGIEQTRMSQSDRI